MSEKTPRYYYVNSDGKEVRYFSEEQVAAPQGFIFAGMSELPIIGAAGYYTKNQSGFKIVDGDEIKTEEATEPKSE